MISAALRQSLAFEGMNSREEEIHEAHEDTFDWVFDYDRFDTNKAAFCKWLHGTDRLFWICGKAASGRSTLMRKICHDDKKLQGHLKQWAPKGIVTIAKMFFTAEGTELQRSQEGLLRSLLWEALEEQPTLAAQVLTPHLKKTAYATDRFSWTLPELRMAFDTLLKLASTEHRFCFFIDGLDEYNVISTTSAYPPEYYIETDDEKGLEIRAGHRDIAKVLLSAPKNEFVKICASAGHPMTFKAFSRNVRLSSSSILRKETWKSSCTPRYRIAYGNRLPPNTRIAQVRLLKMHPGFFYGSALPQIPLSTA
jgi:hypothetical protein